MNVDDILAPCTLVQIVDVLSDDDDLLASGFRPSKRQMRWIGCRPRNDSAPHVVPLPNQHRIAVECILSGEILGTVLLPPAVRIAKGGDAAFGRNAGSRNDQQALGASQAMSKAIEVVHVIKCRGGRRLPASWMFL